jgi:hypothetical protein
LHKVGQDGTYICLKLKEKLGKCEMIRNFNNFIAFVMFAVKKLEALLILVEKYAHVSLENFF